MTGPVARIMAGALVAASVVACGPKTGALEQSSRSPSGPRVDRSAVFVPRVGDFASVETFEIVPKRMSEAANTMVSVVIPRIRERGGLREVWILRSDATSQLEIVSIWSEAVQFQQWQMSKDRVEVYQALGPVLTAQPAADAVSVIGLIEARGQR